jgi:hypothetical protein
LWCQIKQTRKRYNRVTWDGVGSRAVDDRIPTKKLRIGLQVILQ